jgi:hypothetical protein
MAGCGCARWWRDPLTWHPCPPPLPLPQAPEYRGFKDVTSNTDVEIHDGRIYINLPPTCTLMFRHKSL